MLSVDLLTSFALLPQSRGCKIVALLQFGSNPFFFILAQFHQETALHNPYTL